VVTTRRKVAGFRLVALMTAAIAATIGCPSASTPTSAPMAPTLVDASASSSEAGLAAPEVDAGALDVPPDAAAAAPEAASLADATPADMLNVPAGPFTMGADSGGEEDERPAHEVTLAAFWLDRTEVTNDAYAACVAAKACGPSSTHIASATHAGPDALFARPKQPVVGVTWSDARTFCAWKGKRLPREAEFEKACRGGDARRFPWGNDAPTRERTVFARAYGAEGTDDVGAHPTGRGPYGHDDLAGNVWEWLEDEYDPVAYTRDGAPKGMPGTCAEITKTLNKLRTDGRQGFTGSNPLPTECEHVLRGGAYNYDGPGLRSTNRVHHPGRYRLVMTGFRCAKDAP
jgi:formylglycine-generating enzyme required for sulfatase activity